MTNERPWRATVLTLFPEMFPGPLGASLPGKAAACIHCGSERVHTFDSRAEARHYDALRLKLKAGFISGLEVHPRYPLYVNGKPLGYYEADFTYVVPGEGVRVVDVKGGKATDTPQSRWKRKHFEYQTGIPVEVVRM